MGFCQSVEQMKSAMSLVLLRRFVFLMPSFFLLPELLEIQGVWPTLCLSELLTLLVTFMMYIVKVKRRNSI